MEEHHGRGVLLQRLLQDHARIHRRPVDGAIEEFLDLDQAMPCVEVDDPEHLVAPPGELQAKKTLDVRGSGEGAAGTVSTRQHGEGELHHGGFLASGQGRGREGLKAVLILTGGG